MYVKYTHGAYTAVSGVSTATISRSVPGLAIGRNVFQSDISETAPREVALRDRTPRDTGTDFRNRLTGNVQGD